MNQMTLLLKLAKKIKKEKKEKSKILDSLQSAGILTKDGNFTKQYKHLNKIFKEN
jgi:hypothetical protein